MDIDSKSPRSGPVRASQVRFPSTSSRPSLARVWEPIQQAIPNWQRFYDPTRLVEDISAETLNGFGGSSAKLRYNDPTTTKDDVKAGAPKRYTLKPDVYKGNKPKGCAETEEAISNIFDALACYPYVRSARATLPAYDFETGKYVALTGRVKPRLDPIGDELTFDSSTWTNTIKDSLILDFLIQKGIGNDDTLPRQYSLIQGPQMAEPSVLITDFDCALRSLTKPQMGTNDVYPLGPLRLLPRGVPVPLPPQAVSFVFRDYLRGEYDIPFELWHEGLDLLNERFPKRHELKDYLQPIRPLFVAGKGYYGMSDLNELTRVWDAHIRRELPRSITVFQAQLEKDRAKGSRAQLWLQDKWLDTSVAIGGTLTERVSSRLAAKEWKSIPQIQNPGIGSSFE
jgi:hypothetical protein